MGEGRIWKCKSKRFLDHALQILTNVEKRFFLTNVVTFLDRSRGSYFRKVVGLDPTILPLDAPLAELLRINIMPQYETVFPISVTTNYYF